MATFNYSTDILYSTISGIVDGDRIDLSSAAKLTIDISTVEISQVDFNNTFQSLHFLNPSTSQPIIIRATGQWNGNSGTMILDGARISLPNADGTSGQTFQVPADSLGNYPTRIGWMWVAGERWTEASSFTEMYGDGDVRAKHFTYNNANGLISTGDGTNGERPTGTVEIENIYFEGNAQTFFLSGTKIIGAGGVVFIVSHFSSDFIINVDASASWGLVNYSGGFSPTFLRKHRYGNFFNVGVGSSYNIRTTLAESTTGDYIVLQTESDASTEVFQNFNVAMYGTVEARVLKQRNTTFSRVRMYNNGGDLTLKIRQGSGTVLTPYGGINGTWRLYWTNGYLRTDTSPDATIHGRYEGVFKVPTIKLEETNAWTGERENVFNLDLGTWEIGSDTDDPSSDHDIVFPSDMQVDEVFNTSGFSNGTINRLIYNGTASSGSRDFNTWTPKGWRFSNILLPNDTDHGFQPEDNQELHFVSCIGQTPSFGRNMSHSTVIKNSGKTTGQVWFMPHPDGDNAGFVTGTESDLVYTTYQVYYKPGTKTFTRSGVIQGSGVPTAWTFLGSNLQNFTFAYKVWEATDPEPTDYATITLSGSSADSTSLSALQSAMSEFTTSTKYYFKYTVEKNSSEVNLGEIRGFYFDVSLDPNFIWTPPGVEISFTMPNILDGSQFIVWNLTQNKYVALDFATSSGVSATLTEKLDYDDGDSGQVWVAYQSGLTVMKKVKVDFTFGVNDISIPTTQEVLTEHSAANGFVDGSTVDWLTLDPANPSVLQFDASTTNLPQDSNGNATAKKWSMVSWYYYAIANIPLGIQLFFDEMDIIDGANARLNNGVKLDNIGDRQIYFIDFDKNLFASDGSSWVVGQHTGNYGVTSINKIPSNITTTEPFTTGQAANIALIGTINTLVEEVHKLQGLKTGVRVDVTPTEMSTSDNSITVAIGGNGEDNSTLERQT